MPRTHVLLMILGGLILGLFCQIIWDRKDKDKTFGEKLRDLWYVYLLGLISTGTFILGLTLWVGDQGWATEELEQRGREMIVGLLSEPDYLRSTITPDRIERLMIASAEARSAAPLRQEVNYGDAIREMVNAIPSNKPIRDKYDVIIDHSLVTVDGVQVIKADITDRFKLVNPTTKRMPWVQPLGLTLQKIDGVEVKSLVVKQPSLLIDEKEDTFTISKKNVIGGGISYVGSKTLLIDKEVTIAFNFVVLLPLNDISLRWYRVATRNVTVEYSKPENFEPELFLFGLKQAGKMDPKDAKPKRWRWDIPELAAPGQGFFLRWKIK